MMGTWRGSLLRKSPRLRQRVGTARSTSATATVPYSLASAMVRPAWSHTAVSIQWRLMSS